MPETEVIAWLESEIRKAIDDGFVTFISGMARGVDIWAAEIVLRLRDEGKPIHLICASPFEGFDFSSMGGGSGNGFSSFFENLFGGGGFHSRHQSSMQGGMQQDMEASVSIDLYTALLGGEVMVQLGDGSRIKLRVKPETQNGTKVRLRAKGYDLGNGQRSDLIITYNVTLPTGLNARQKELLRQMQQLS